MLRLTVCSVLLAFAAQQVFSVPKTKTELTSSGTANHLRVAVPGLKDSNPGITRRHEFRHGNEFHSVYEKGLPVVPGGGVKQQYFFVSTDYTVYDVPRDRLIPFFDPEDWMNCDCDQPFPRELDIPPRFAIYNPVTVQAPLPDVPKDLISVKYTGMYYACPVSANPFEFAWYKNKLEVSPCRWMWYQSMQDYHFNKQHK